MFGIIWQCLFAFQARATVLLDSDAIWGEKLIPTFFFFFSEKVPQQLQHEWRDMREFSLFFLFCLWPSLVSSHHTHFARLYFQWQLKPWRDIFSIFYFFEGASERETEPESAMPEKHESCQHFSEKGPHVWEGGNAWERTCKETH